jgi:F-type H+-transporting ATPase subunit a
MAASLHPPVLTDLIYNNLPESAHAFFEAHKIGHADVNNVLNSWLVMAILIVFALLIKGKLQMVPRGLQNFWEVVVVSLDDFVKGILGDDKGGPFVPLVATLALFILLCNLIGVLPFFQSATNNLNTTLALSIIVFVVSQGLGVYKHGFGYIKHFFGPVPWLIPLMLPIEIISHLSRILSLSFRLFGNIMGEDLAVIILTVLAPYLVPLPMMFLQVFTSFVQTLVFIMLTTIYISGSLEEAH